jgi:hypothetical protein
VYLIENRVNQRGIEIVLRPVAIKLTYALQNTPKALSVSSFEAPEVIPTNTAKRTSTLSNWEAVSLGNRRASEGVVATVIVLCCPLCLMVAVSP